MKIRNKMNLAAACGALLLTAGLCAAQGDKSADQPKYFHLDFAVKEIDNGKAVNTRHYTTTAMTGESTPVSCTIRSGSKLPLQTGGGSSTQFVYVDIGVSIDCRSMKEIDGSLAISVTAEISSAAPTANQPLIRQTKWSSNVIIPVGKPAVIFSSDDAAGNGQMQLELTATAIPAR
jgi:hypothetical protein